MAPSSFPIFFVPFTLLFLLLPCWPSFAPSRVSPQDLHTCCYLLLLPSPPALFILRISVCHFFQNIFPALILSNSVCPSWSLPACFFIALVTFNAICTHVILYCWLPCQIGHALREGTLSVSSAHCHVTILILLCDAQ